MRAQVWSSARRSQEVDYLLDYAIERLLSSWQWEAKANGSHAISELAIADEGQARALYFAAASVAEVALIYGDESWDGKGWPSFSRWKSMVVEAALGSSLCPAPVERAA